MTNLGDLGVPPPEELAQMQAAAAQALQPAVADLRRVAESMQPIMMQMRPVLEIIARQRSAMEEMRLSFEAAMKVQPPPQTRAELAAIVHQLRDLRIPRTPNLLPQQEAEQAVLDLMPETAGEVDEVRQGVAEIEQNPEYKSTVRRLIEGIDWGGVGELTEWGALILAARLLFQVADWPVTRNLSGPQTAALNNKFLVLAIIVSLATIILTTRRRS